MIPALKAEFRKLLTVRSTYVIALVAFALLTFVSLYVEGYKNGIAVTAPGGSLFLAGSIVQHSSILSIFGAIVALLLATHEYRYNTVMYTLTLVRRRSNVLVAKIVAVVAYVLVLGITGGLIGLAGMIIGLHLSGHGLPMQDLSLSTYFAKLLVFCEGWGLTGLLLGILLRNQVAALAVLFIVPNTVEGLLSLLLKEHSVYLPFTALSQVVSPPVLAGAVPRQMAESNTITLSPLQGTLVFAAYLVAVWAITWGLFLRRDAN
jgi:ABC-type transport system involved in multi-copper enzyme maturation permease subunit